MARTDAATSNTATASDTPPMAVSAEPIGTEPVGTIRCLAGAVTVVRADGAALPARAGDPLFRGDRIETGGDGRVGITFRNGTTFNLAGDARASLAEFGTDADQALTSARLAVSQGAFAVFGGRVARNGGLAIETPLATLRGNPQCGAIGTLTLVALTFVLLQDLEAAPFDPFLLDDIITYKDMQHGTFEITTKGANQQTIVVDDPEVMVVVRPTADGVAVEQVINTTADMANLLSASQDANATYRVAQADPFTSGAPGGQRASLGSTDFFDGPLGRNTSSQGGPLALLPPESRPGGDGSTPDGPPPNNDDTPTARIAINTDATIIVDETDGAGTPGEVDAAAGGDFGRYTILGASLFTDTSEYGANGPALVDATVYSLRLREPESGLVDTASGEDVTLFRVNGVIEGHAGTTVGAPLVFTLSIDPETGDVTLTQYRAVVHDIATLGDTSEPAMLADDVVGVTVTVKDFDGDISRDTDNLNGVVQFLDDGPVGNVVLAATALDDDAQPLFPGNPDGSGDVPNATTLSGGAGSLFNPGADGVESISFTAPVGLQAIYEDPVSGLALQETLSYDTTIVAGHTILTATGETSGDTVFTLDVAPDGSYTFTLLAPLVHPTAGASEENRPVTVGFTVTDRDGDTATGSLTVDVNDDTPSIGAIQDAVMPAINDTAVHGTWQPVFGADGPIATAAVGIALGTPPDGTTYSAPVATGTSVAGHALFAITVTTATVAYTFYEYTHFDPVAQSAEMIAFSDPAGADPFFALHVGVDGTYTFDLATISGLLQTASAASADPGNYGSDMFIVGTQFYDASSLPIGATPDIVVDGFTGVTPEDLFVNANGIGVGSGNFDNDERMTFAFNDAQTEVAFEIGKLQTGASVTFSVSVDGGSAQLFTVLATDPSLDITAAMFTLANFTSVDITKVANAAPPVGFTDDASVDIADISYNSHVVVGNDTQLTFALTVTDGDGDAFTSADDLSIALIGSQSGSYLLAGTDDASEVFAASAVDDTFSGGTGAGDAPLGDTVDYGNTVGGTGVTVDLSFAGAQDTIASGSDTLTGIENLIGSDYADLLFGNGDVNLLIGGDGDDVLVGRGASDTLVGGDGTDHFRFLATTDGADHILDFGAGDVLEFSNVDFGGLGAGPLDAAHFGSGVSTSDGTFADSGPGFWYSTTNQTLYYDSNGNTAGGLVALAVLENGAVIEHTDIRIV